MPLSVDWLAAAAGFHDGDRPAGSGKRHDTRSARRIWRRLATVACWLLFGFGASAYWSYPQRFPRIAVSLYERSGVRPWWLRQTSVSAAPNVRRSWLRLESMKKQSFRGTVAVVGLLSDPATAGPGVPLKRPREPAADQLVMRKRKGRRRRQGPVVKVAWITAAVMIVVALTGLVAVVDGAVRSVRASGVAPGAGLGA